jgi:hypothetical protein
LRRISARQTGPLALVGLAACFEHLQLRRFTLASLLCVRSLEHVDLTGQLGTRSSLALALGLPAIGILARRVGLALHELQLAGERCVRLLELGNLQVDDALCASGRVETMRRRGEARLRDLDRRGRHRPLLREGDGRGTPAVATGGERGYHRVSAWPHRARPVTLGVLGLDLFVMGRLSSGSRQVRLRLARARCRDCAGHAGILLLIPEVAAPLERIIAGLQSRIKPRLPLRRLLRARRCGAKPRDVVLGHGRVSDGLAHVGLALVGKRIVASLHGCLEATHKLLVCAGRGGRLDCRGEL